MGRSVIDKTDIKGLIDIRPQFEGNPITIVPGAPVRPLLDEIAPQVLEQLGLKLDSTKGPVDVLVIDHVEKPTPN